ncbi:MAG: patatin-like phospholipase family protein [Kineosporiaceae bacterium]|nr:patatin-like phospholipase family protein [Kineosporiaceae bacterium]
MTENPWRAVIRLQDRHRYLRMLEPHPPLMLDLDAALPRADHHLLHSPAAMTRTATNFPDPDHVSDYLAHSADLTMRGGTAAAVTYPLGVCALAEHYIFRRVGGSSAGAVTAALTAAAELGRTTPCVQPAAVPGTPGGDAAPAVQSGFAGLAEMIGWLAGQDVAGPALADGATHPDAPAWPERHRLTRMFQPAPGTRDAYRVLIALMRLPLGHTARERAVPLIAAVLAALRRGPRLIVVLVWLGALLAWLGGTAAVVRGASLPLPLTGLISLTLGVTTALAALAATAITCAIAVRSVLVRRPEAEHFGLVPGVQLPDMDAAPRGLLSRRLDRLIGVPAVGDVPAVVDWLTDRIDDLAGIPLGDNGSSDSRPALTFGELWLGRLGAPSAAETHQLRRAADDAQVRCIDLAVVTTNLAQSRPYTLPFLTAERAEREGASRFLFCRSCLAGVLPVRVVAQMILASPAQARESTCPRHDGEILHEVPDPWDMPVAAAVRMSMAMPGLVRAVPLYTLDVESPGPLQDPYGRVVAPTPPPPAVFVPRVQWFSDGGVTSNFPIHSFDALLPRWPTFGFNLAHLPTTPQGEEQLAEWVSVPAQDAAPRARTWRRVATPSAFVGALTGTALTWRDAMQADLPGVRGRIAVVRHGTGETDSALFLPQQTILALALRGFHAGQALRQRFTGPDGELTDQTQTDRHRWIRLRMALRAYRELSLDISARLPLYSDLAASYRVPESLTTWFTPPIAPGTTDPAWPDAAAAVTHLRALSAGGVLDWDTDYGAPPIDPDLRITPLE